QLLPEFLERLEDRRKFKVGVLGRRSPPVHDRAMREIDESHARLWTRGRLRKGSRCGNHRLQQRQSYRDTCATKEHAARKMLLRYEHGFSLLHIINHRGTKTQKKPQQQCGKYPHCSWTAFNRLARFWRN